MRVIGMAAEHGVDVHVPQAGQDAHALGGNHLRVGRDWKRADLSDRLNFVAIDQDHAVADGRAAEAIDQRSAHQRFLAGLRRHDGSQRAEYQDEGLHRKIISSGVCGLFAG